MKVNHPRFFIQAFALLAGFFAITLYLSFQWEKKLIIYPSGMDLARAQSSGEDEEEAEEEAEEEEEEAAPKPKRPVQERTEKGTAQKIWSSDGTLSARYDFVNFNKDKLSISFAMPDKEYRTYLTGYGYADADMAILTKWHNDARRKEWDKAVKTGGKEAGEKALEPVEWEYKMRLKALLSSRGFTLRTGDVIECDVPAIVKRNVPVLKPLALAFQKIATEKRYGPEETVGAALSMVQTAIFYKIPPMIENGTHTGGMLPPAKALLSGWGDCDTKTTLAASILGNWTGIRLVGIAVPGHYLMAIKRIPAKGDMFVEYRGAQYVLIEPAGPAWLVPGMVGRTTTALLRGSEGYKVEPFF